MKNMMILFLIAMTISCDKEDEGNYCFSFDIRQCQTDHFASDVPESDSKELREEKLQNWLEAQGIEVTDVKLDLNYHEAVCEACHVCPQGDRYFVRHVNEIDESVLESMDLLSYEELDCEDAF